MTKQNVLLVYELVPEDNQVFFFQATEKEVADLKEIADTFMNTVDLTEKQEEIHSRLCEDLGEKGKWGQAKVKGGVKELPAGTLFILTGFIL